VSSTMIPMRSLTTLLLPGGLLTLVGLALFRPGVLPEFTQPYVQAYPYVVFGVGTILGWYFHRTRVVFALLILAVAGVVLRFVGTEHAAPDSVAGFVFAAIALFLPINLAAYALVKERGLFTTHGVARVVIIAAEIVAVDLIIRLDWHAPRDWLQHALNHEGLGNWTALPGTGVAAFVCATILLAGRCVAKRDPIEAGYLWAVISGFIALHGMGRGWVPAPFLATAGLALIWALVETTYRMAFYDELTGLPGRRALNEALLQVGSRYTVAMADVDHFKRFNDLFGHEVGDQALRMVAAKLSSITGGGKAFRFGGEEFAILFPRASAAEAVPHLEAARRAVAASCFVLRGAGRPRKKPTTAKSTNAPRVAVSLTVSIGMAEPNERNPKTDPHQVLKAADKALYRAKSAGRNRLMV
jgi:diguanylate cyclase (GGDEF)-like protein